MVVCLLYINLSQTKEPWFNNFTQEQLLLYFSYILPSFKVYEHYRQFHPYPPLNRAAFCNFKRLTVYLLELLSSTSPPLLDQKLKAAGVELLHELMLTVIVRKHDYHVSYILTVLARDITTACKICDVLVQV